MSNAWWYGAVAALFITALAYIFYRVPDRKLLAVYAFLGGLTYMAEFVVLVLLDGYRYYPRIMADEFFDNIVGAIVSDAVSIPIAGLLIAAFQLGWKAMAGLTAFILGVEVLFVHLRIYAHHWWQYPYTAAGLIVWSLLGKLAYRQVRARVNRPFRFILLFCTNMLIQSSLVFILAALFHAYFYDIGWFEEKTRDHVAFATTYIMFLSVLFAALVTFEIKWSWRIAAITLLLGVDFLLITSGLLHISPRWSLFHFYGLRLLLLAALEGFNRLVLAGGSAGSPSAPGD